MKSDKTQIFPTNPNPFCFIIIQNLYYIEVHQQKKANQCQSTFTRPYKMCIPYNRNFWYILSHSLIFFSTTSNLGKWVGLAIQA